MTEISGMGQSQKVTGPALSANIPPPTHTHTLRKKLARLLRTVLKKCAHPKTKKTFEVIKTAVYSAS